MKKNKLKKLKAGKKIEKNKKIKIMMIIMTILIMKMKKKLKIRKKKWKNETLKKFRICLQKKNIFPTPQKKQKRKHKYK